MAIVPILLFGAAGFFLGKYWATSGLGVFLFVVMGVFVGHSFTAIFFTRQYLKMMRESSERLESRGSNVITTMYMPAISAVTCIVIILVCLKKGVFRSGSIWMPTIASLVLWGIAGGAIIGNKLGQWAREEMEKRKGS